MKLESKFKNIVDKLNAAGLLHYGTETGEIEALVGGLMEDLEQADHDLIWLQCLESAGMDNWSGYDYAHEEMQEYYPEDYE
ncbi:hypothetical protein ACEV6Q_04120 [Enterobacter ludwigii]|uniref:hypothetical protein n=1 Tax=Enterobacter ludwigii TaxID=299767 RepID=UPI003BEEF473